MKTTTTAVNLSNISSMTFARHGKAAKVNESDRDCDRILTPLGVRQSEALKNELDRRFQFDLVLSSPLPRAVQMTEIATGKKPVTVKELEIPEDQTLPLNVMFNELAYAPLVNVSLPEGKLGYYQHELGGHLKTWAQETILILIDLANEAAEEIGHPINVFVGGHAVCQNALAQALTELLPDQESDSVTACQSMIQVNILGEAHAIRLLIDNPDQPLCTIIEPKM